MKFWRRGALALLAVCPLVGASCGGSDDPAAATRVSEADSAGGAQTDGRPTVAVTTNILGDVVEQMVGDHVDVVTIMPVGADPHDFQPSARQIAEIGDAAVLIVNGADFEEGLIDVIQSVGADGTPVFEAISAVNTIEFGEGGRDDEDEHNGDEDAHESVDPHFFTDPARMAEAATAILDYLAANLGGVDVEAMRAGATGYIAQLEALDTEVAAMFEGLSDERRVLVTNHEVFGYFADRYDFEVVGAVIPTGSTSDGASAQELAELAETIEAEGVRVIFGDFSSSDELVRSLAGEVGDIDVVQLYSESLGEADSDGATYIDMVRSNAEQIAAALAG